MSGIELWFSSAVLSIILIASFYSAFRYLRLARVIEDIPTAKVASAPQGYVELQGKAQAPEDGELVSPLTDTPCSWYRYTVEEKDGGHDEEVQGDGWTAIECRETEQPLILQDETGRCKIHHAGAEMTPDEVEIWYGFSETPGKKTKGSGTKRKSRRILGLNFEYEGGANLSTNGSYRYIEERIHIGDPLYVIGLFRTMTDYDHKREIESRAGVLLKEWKNNPKAIKHFDRDGDGKLNPTEWEAARKVAIAKMEREYQANRAAVIEHSVKKPKDRQQPFLITTLEEFDLAARYRGLALLSIIVFFVGLIFGWWFWF